MDKSIWVGSPQQYKLFDTFFAANCPVIVEEDMEGQRIEENRLYLGMRAGPSQCIRFLIHEMAHLVEIDDARMLVRGWGLHLPKIYIPGRYSHMVPVPITHQASLRECRVIALAWHLQNFLGIKESAREMVGSLEYMPDYENVVPYETGMSLNEIDNLRMNFLANKVIEYANKYSITFFVIEWFRKMELLKHGAQNYARSNSL